MDPKIQGFCVLTMVNVQKWKHLPQYCVPTARTL